VGLGCRGLWDGLFGMDGFNAWQRRKGFGFERVGFHQMASWAWVTGHGYGARTSSHYGLRSWLWDTTDNGHWNADHVFMIPGSRHLSFLAVGFIDAARLLVPRGRQE